MFRREIFVMMIPIIDYENTHYNEMDEGLSVKSISQNWVKRYNSKMCST